MRRFASVRSGGGSFELGAWSGLSVEVPMRTLHGLLVRSSNMQLKAWNSLEACAWACMASRP